MVISLADTAINTRSTAILRNSLSKLSQSQQSFAVFRATLAASCLAVALNCPALGAPQFQGIIEQNIIQSKADQTSLKTAQAVLVDDTFSQNLVHEKLSHQTYERATTASPPIINNFEIVSEGLWRGAAPSQQALKSLAEKGVKTIVDLRMAGQGAQEEASSAKTLGIRYVHMPLGFKSPSLLKVAQFLNIVNNPANQPVFVHCRYGADRTGTLVAIFRVIHDHWNFNQAYTEMRSHHFKPWLASLKNMVARVVESPKMRNEIKVLSEKPAALDKQIAAKLSHGS